MSNKRFLPLFGSGTLARAVRRGGCILPGLDFEDARAAPLIGMLGLAAALALAWRPQGQRFNRR
jgi:hypothetical protein